MRGLVSCALLCALSACDAGPTAVVEPGEIRQRIVARAVVEPRGGVARVRAHRLSRVTEVLVTEGESVQRGDTLARVDARSLLEEESIVAPISGVVVACHTNVGDDVHGGEGPLFEVANLDRLQVRLEVEDENASRLVVGSTARITTEGGRQTLASGTVDRLSPRMQPREIGAGDVLTRVRRLVRVAWIDVEPSAALVAGRELEVVIELSAEAATARVPREAVEVRGGRALVSVPRPLADREVEVTLGRSDERYVEVAGIEVGTPVRLRAAHL